MTSKCRSTAVLAVSAMPTSMPLTSTGWATAAAVAKNAASEPMLSWPVAASQIPVTRPAPRASSGRSVTTRLNAAWWRAFATSVSRSRPACSAKLSSASRPRPKALSTLMPWTDSSTVVARSPARSWLRLVAREKFRRKTAP